MLILILKDITITTCISVCLAVILVTAQKYLSNYGECKITINSKKEMIVTGGINLLAALSDKQIYIPSACGGRGSCGACKCKVTQGGGPVLPTEKPFLSPNEISQNVRLACQVKIKTDIYIEIPESIFNIRRYKTEVTEIIDYSYDTKGITFKLIDPDKIDFIAGQYVQLETKPYGNVKQSVVRAYSISSNPINSDHIQLIVRLVPDGICTTWVHNYLKVNDEVFITGPFGDFVIQDTSADIFFIAGGSGIAPIKAMLEYLQSIGTTRRMRYFYGARTCKDLYLTEEMHSFENVFTDYKYIPVLSRPCENENWLGKIGYVMSYFVDEIRDPKNTEAYLCGSPGMIDAVVKSLVQYGIPKDKIYFDSFG